MSTVQATNNKGRFDGKVVIVTGSSSGIGQTTILKYALEGASVVVQGTNQVNIDKTLHLLKDSGIPDSRYHYVRGYLEKDEVIQSIVDETIQKFNKIDVVVCNAAVSGDSNETNVLSMKSLRKVFEVNLFSCVNLVQKSVPYLNRTKGNVILVSSVLSHRTSFSMQFYGLTKAALDHYAKNAAMLYGPLNIRINSIRVGVVKTPIYDRLQNSDFVDEFLDQVMSNAVVNRMAESYEIADFIAFLSSDEAQFITGAVLDIDGGLCAYMFPSKKDFDPSIIPFLNNNV